VKTTLPDNIEVSYLRCVRHLRYVRGNRGAAEIRAARGVRLVPLAGLAVSIGLLTDALEPCLAAGGLAGPAALLAASMAALFAVLLAIVSVSVVAAIAAMLMPPARGAALRTSSFPPSPGVRGGVAPSIRGVVPAILSVCARKRRYGTAGQLPAATAEAAATLAPLPRDAP
jgi:hypothetical protein